MFRAAAIQLLAEQFLELDARRNQLEKDCRDIKKHLTSLKEEMQSMVGIAETLNIPHVITIGNFCISQIKKHRAVQAHEYDYVEFKVVEVPNPKFSK